MFTTKTTALLILLTLSKVGTNDAHMFEHSDTNERGDVNRLGTKKFLRFNDHGIINANTSRRTAEEVNYCKKRKNGYRLRSTDTANASDLDTSKHGFPWSPVPGQPGKIFDSNCAVINCPCASGIACTDVSNNGDLSGLTHQCATPAPASEPSASPSNDRSDTPSAAPSSAPSREPSSVPSFKPSQMPSKEPTGYPTISIAPSSSNKPTGVPTSGCNDCKGGTCVNGYCAKTGTSDEIQLWCDSLEDGRKCCQGNEACSWIQTTVTVFENSCNGEYACTELGGLGVRYTFGPGSCSGGDWNCEGVGTAAKAGSTVTIEENACSGGGTACQYLASHAETELSVHIGKGACSGEWASCLAVATTNRKALRTLSIGAGACSDGIGACYALADYGQGNPDPLTSIVVAADTCVGYQACAEIAWSTAFMQRIEVQPSACKGQQACYGIGYASSYKSVTVSGGSCNGLYACLSEGSRSVETGDFVVADPSPV